MMTIRKIITHPLNSLLSHFDLQVRRVRSVPDELVPVFDDPLEAMHIVRAGGRAAFQCSITKIIDSNGFSMGTWHPFVATLQIYKHAGPAAAEGMLAQYYSSHQPQTMAEALVGFATPPQNLAQADPLLYYLRPWLGHSEEKMLRGIRNFIERDNAEHGRPDLKLEHGFQMHGPVHAEKRRFELQRLCHIFDHLRSKGYQRRHGDLRVSMLRRGNDFRFFCGPGYHRSAALAALGYKNAPAQFSGLPVPVDIAESTYWPQVRSGVWTKAEAESYFNYLFDFDAREWAIERGFSAPPQALKK